MNIVVVVKQVPDLAEELEIADNGIELNAEYLSWIINEYDDHALEEALHLKDETGGTVTVMGLGTEGIDDVLYTCLAKGADKAIKVGAFDMPLDSHSAAQVFAEVLKETSYDLVLTGVQSITDLDGQVGPLLATTLDIPHVSVVTHIAPASAARAVQVHQEYAGGMYAEFEIDLPALLGVQAARVIPRYAPVSRVRQLMKSTTLEEAPVSVEAAAGVVVQRMFVPEAGGHAEMIEGDTDAVVERLSGILSERGILTK